EGDCNSEVSNLSAIFHLSFPVADLDQAVSFYVDQLGASVGRRTSGFVDIFLFGAQVTLHSDVSNVTVPMPRTRHFGATLTWGSWEALRGKLTPQIIGEGPSHRYVGQPIEQAKFMISDPPGNLMELKTYRNPEAVLGVLGQAIGS